MVPERCTFTPGDRVDEAYTVEGLLGEGTFGAVYRVRDAGQRVYALKLLKLWTVTPDECRQLRGRFLMEFETGKIRSSHLLHTYRCGEVAGNPYIVMEYCAGGDLRRYVATHGVDFTRVGREILLGLRDLHACGKVHRDLKPENVLLRADGVAVLTDFGISGDRNKRMTERGWFGRPKQVFGTFPYMPPEQVNPPCGGQATVLPTTDLFSFGVMMYELLVGRLPFGELTEQTLPLFLERGRTGRWDREALRRVDARGVWLPVVEGCLVPNFKERLPSASAVLRLLPGDAVAAEAEAPLSRELGEGCRGVLLRVMQGEEYGKTYLLNDLLRGNRILTMGRADRTVRNAVALREERSAFVSRRHCTLEWDADARRWFLRDGQWVQREDGGEWCPSLNGTYVNSTEVDAGGWPLQPGDIVSLGDVKLRVECYS